MLNYFPLPNSPTAANPGQYVNQKSVDVPKHSYVIRFDVKPTKKDDVVLESAMVDFRQRRAGHVRLA